MQRKLKLNSRVEKLLLLLLIIIIIITIIALKRSAQKARAGESMPAEEVRDIKMKQNIFHWDYRKDVLMESWILLIVGLRM